jgi:hypothetical protein
MILRRCCWHTATNLQPYFDAGLYKMPGDGDMQVCEGSNFFSVFLTFPSYLLFSFHDFISSTPLHPFSFAFVFPFLSTLVGYYKISVNQGAIVISCIIISLALFLICQSLPPKDLDCIRSLALGLRLRERLSGFLL